MGIVFKNLILKHRKTGIQLTKVFMDQGLSSLTTFMAGILLARSCSKDDYAVYVLAFSIILTVLGFQRSLISTPYTICRNDFREGLRFRYLSAIFLFRRLLLGGVVVLGLPFLMWVIFKKTPDQWPFLILFLLTLAGYTYCAFMKDTLLAELKVNENLWLGIVVNLSVLAGLLLLFFLDRLTVSYYFVLLAVCMLLFPKAFRMFIYAGRKVRLTQRQAFFFFRISWRQGKWLTATSVLFSVTSQVYPWVMMFFWGSAEVAVFGVATGASRFFNPVLLGLKSYYLPRLSMCRDDRREYLHTLGGLFILMCGLAIILIPVGYFWGGAIIELLYSSKYQGLGILAFLVFCDQAVMVMVLPVEIGLNAQKRTDALFKGVLIRMVLMLVLGLFLCIKFGAAGCVMAFIIEKSLAGIYGAGIIFKSLKRTRARGE